MQFVEQFEHLVQERGLSINKVFSQLKIGKNSYSYWKEKGNLPSGETLLKLAEFFDCSVDYLLGREAPKKEPTAFEDERQAELLEIFDRMPDEESKENLMQVVRSFEIMNKYEIQHQYIGGIAAKGGNKPIVHRIPPKKK